MQTKRITCIRCPVGCQMDVTINGGFRVTGNECKLGREYAETEAVAPKRTLATTIRVCYDGKKTIAPVRTNGDIPKGLLFDAMDVINSVTLDRAMPIGAIAINDLLGTGVDVILTDDVR